MASLTKMEVVLKDENAKITAKLKVLNSVYIFTLKVLSPLYMSNYMRVNTALVTYPCEITALAQF